MGILSFFKNWEWYHWVVLALIGSVIVYLLYQLWVRRTRKWVYITDKEVSLLGLPPMPNAPPKTMDCKGAEEHTLFLVNGGELNRLKAHARHNGIELELGGKGTGVMCYPPKRKAQEEHDEGEEKKKQKEETELQEEKEETELQEEKEETELQEEEEETELQEEEEEEDSQDFFRELYNAGKIKSLEDFEMYRRDKTLREEALREAREELALREAREEQALLQAAEEERRNLIRRGHTERQILRDFQQRRQDDDEYRDSLALADAHSATYPARSFGP